MAWINQTDFFTRSLENDLISLRALKGALVTLAVQHGLTQDSDALARLKEIDEAIAATERMVRGGSHHP